MMVADPHSLEEKCIDLAERSQMDGLFELPAAAGRIVLLSANLVDGDPVLSEIATPTIEAAASISGFEAARLREELREDRGLLVVVVLRRPNGKQGAISIALHRPWSAQGSRTLQ